MSFRSVRYQIKNAPDRPLRVDADLADLFPARKWLRRRITGTNQLQLVIAGIVARFRLTASDMTKSEARLNSRIDFLEDSGHVPGYCQLQR